MRCRHFSLLLHNANTANARCWIRNACLYQQRHFARKALSSTLLRHGAKTSVPETYASTQLTLIPHRIMHSSHRVPHGKCQVRFDDYAYASQHIMPVSAVASE